MLLLVGAYFATPAVVQSLAHVIGAPLHLPQSSPNTLSQAPFGVFVAVSVSWQAVVLFLTALVLGRSPLDFPLSGPAALRCAGAGLATGLGVMLFVIGAIWATGDARVTASGQTASQALANGARWLALDAGGALGEELFNRASLYLGVASLFGWRAAAAASGVLFFVEHLGNPGASPVWLLRLALQGVLLAYAVHRTQSIWWSVAYHTGWNWISAPLFGAAGSGYMDEGHVFDFVPRGSPLITGGDVGPEGSLFAFVAVLLAFAVLVVTTRDRSRLAGAHD